MADLNQFLGGGGVGGKYFSPTSGILTVEGDSGVNTWNTILNITTPIMLLDFYGEPYRNDYEVSIRATINGVTSTSPIIDGAASYSLIVKLFEYSRASVANSLGEQEIVPATPMILPKGGVFQGFSPIGSLGDAPVRVVYITGTMEDL